MRLKKRRRVQVSGWRALRRCVIFFIAVCVIPVLLVLLIATDHYMRPVQHSSFLRHQFSPNERAERDGAVMSNNLTMIGLRLEQRKRHLKKYCKYFCLDTIGNDTLHRPNPWEFLVDSKHHLVWCNVFKAASTSWMYNFNILAGYSARFLKKTKLVPMTLARQKYPRPSLQSLREAFNNSVSFLIARHPLERLLSAYRDKLKYALPHTLHRNLGNQIVAKYRNKLRNKADKGKPQQRWPTFPEFVDYLIECVKNGERLDMHWTPITEFCTPCMFDFQIIAHTETLQEDQMFLIKKAKLEHLIQPQWKNPGRGVTANQVSKYYSQLTRSQILQLYHIYRYDFELFNYSLHGYIELGQQDDDPSTLLAAITLKDFQHNSLPHVY